MNKIDKKILDESNMRVKKVKNKYKITFEIDEQLYNRIMSSTTNKPKAKSSPKPPAWAVELISTVKSIDSRLGRVEDRLERVEMRLERIENTPTMKKELSEQK